MAYSQKSRKLSLADTIKPASNVTYPASDITAITNSTTAPTYTGGWNFLFNTGGQPQRMLYGFTWYNYSGNGVKADSGATQPGTASLEPWQVEFYHLGNDFAFWSVNLVQADFIIYVDDMPLTSDWAQTNATAFSSNYYRVQFATTKMRRIRILCSGLTTFTGIMHAAGGNMWAAPQRFRCAVVGDSYIQGGHTDSVEGSIQGAAFGNQLAIQTGWEVFTQGQGSTGYINNGGNTGGKDVYGATSRISTLQALAPLDLIIVYGSGNDSGYTGSAVATAVNAYWNSLATNLPGVPIIVFGVQPGSPSGFTPSLLDSTNTVIKQQAAINPNVAGFVDMRDTTTGVQPWVTGTGNTGAPVYDGNADSFICSDGVHPTREGYRNMIEHSVAALRKIKI
jgi:lysophospholipase L1-like esterase